MWVTRLFPTARCQTRKARVARNQWEHYVESRTNHQYEPPAKPVRKRVKRGELPMQRQEDALLLYLRTHGH